MRKRGESSRRKWRIGSRKPTTYLIIARIPDPDIVSLVRTFPDNVSVRSGESREAHVTLFGPFSLSGRDTPDRLLDHIRTAGSGISYIGFRIGALLQLQGRKGVAIALNLHPEENIRALYAALVKEIHQVTAWCTWIDQPPGQRIFHISLRISISRHEVQGIWNQVQHALHDWTSSSVSGREPGTLHDGCNAPLHLYRIAVMRRGALWRELDLSRDVWLSRGEASNPGLWLSTRREYRIREHLQRSRPAYADRQLRFVISDLHLGHTNIIRYCRRPFSSVLEMDTVLLDNWNYTVKADDEVYYLGDLRHGRNAPPASHFLEKLNGNITYIIGNHDEQLPSSLPFLKLTHQGLDFMLIHDPADVPKDYRGWVIHGHLHNSDYERFPFIDANRRTINVSAELVDYIPVSLDEIAGFARALQVGDRASTLKEARANFGK
jgi:calcineurin-like phosphoesterase family protein